METLEVKSGSFSFEMKTPSVIDATLPEVWNAIDALKRYYNDTPLSQVRIEKDARDPELYHYEVVAVDTREWEQTIRFAPTKISFAFDVSSFWDLKCVTLCTNVRTAFVTLVLGYYASKIEAKWV
tara:strand:+ start:3506 stop:3880 length:375 start_codon:yes stop_codon:yes gene_type:complete